MSSGARMAQNADPPLDDYARHLIGVEKARAAGNLYSQFQFGYQVVTLTLGVQPAVPALVCVLYGMRVGLLRQIAREALEETDR